MRFIVPPELVEKRKKMVAVRMENTKPTMRKVYKLAVARRSFSAAIKAMCQQCTCWERVEVTKCTALACPLWAYRPYQSETETDESLAEVE